MCVRERTSERVYEIERARGLFLFHAVIASCSWSSKRLQRLCKVSPTFSKPFSLTSKYNTGFIYRIVKRTSEKVIFIDEAICFFPIRSYPSCECVLVISSDNKKKVAKITETFAWNASRGKKV